jgi:hypothetical protein
VGGICQVAAGPERPPDEPESPDEAVMKLPQTGSGLVEAESSRALFSFASLTAGAAAMLAGLGLRQNRKDAE